MTKLQTLCAHAQHAIRRFGNDQSGSTAIEYALIAVGVAAVLVAAVTSIGLSVKSGFTSVAAGFN